MEKQYGEFGFPVKYPKLDSIYIERFEPWAGGPKILDTAENDCNTVAVRNLELLQDNDMAC
jgi:hypothetical protein